MSNRIYKGEVRKLGDLKVGDPIQVVSLEGLRPGDLEVGQIGVVVVRTKGYYKNNDICIQITKEDLSNKVTLRVNSARYPYPEESATNLQVLTGRKGQELQAQWLAQAYLHHQFRKHGSITSGCDPEIFAVTPAGEVLPAWEFLPAKADAGVVGVRYDYNTYSYKKIGSEAIAYWDGFQAECAVQHISCANALVDYIRVGLQKVHKAAQAYMPGAHLSGSSVLPVDDGLLQKADNLHVSLGCMPSLNAYGAEGRKVSDPRTLPMRFAGGHIHLSGHKEFQSAAPAVVKSIDALAGIAFVALLEDIDQPVRRQFYGLAGEYRLPPHGLEYRTLSNAWVCHPALAHLAFDLVRAGAMMQLSNVRMPVHPSDATVQQIINECDVAGARKCIKANWPMWKKLIQDYYTAGGATQADSEALLEALLMQGVKEFMQIDAVAENWLLDKEESQNSGVINGMDSRDNWATHSESEACSVMSLSKNLKKYVPQVEAALAAKA